MSGVGSLKRRWISTDHQEQSSTSPHFSEKRKEVTGLSVSRASPRYKLKRVREKTPNIYSSSNLEVLSGGQIKFTKGRNAKYDTVKVDNSIVPKLKPEFEAMGIYKQPTGIVQAHYKSPDEILTEDYKFEANELVYLSRQEIKGYTKVELPDEDVTNAIHYYAARRIKSRLGLTDEEFDKNYCRFLDGTALLGLSALLTKWVEDCCGDATFKGYMEKIVKNGSEKLSSIDEFIRVHDDEDEDEDIEDDGDEIEEKEIRDAYNWTHPRKGSRSTKSNSNSRDTSDSSSVDGDSLSEDIEPIQITKTVNRS